MSQRKIIKTQLLSKIYTMGEVNVQALNEINLTVAEGDFVAIMGASGSGKSTLMNILGCLDSPTSGKYYLDETDVGALNRDELARLRNRKLGFVFQSYNLLARTSALENVELLLLYNPSVKLRQRHELSVKALEEVGLTDRMDHFPNQLSGGEQQRVAIARALINNPLVIFADEPTGNLDTRTSFEVMDLFQKLNDEGHTVVMVTHEEDIARFSRRKVLLRDGKIVSDVPVKLRSNAKKSLAALHSKEYHNVKD